MATIHAKGKVNVDVDAFLTDARKRSHMEDRGLVEDALRQKKYGAPDVRFYTEQNPWSVRFTYYRLEICRSKYPDDPGKE